MIGKPKQGERIRTWTQAVDEGTGGKVGCENFCFLRLN